MPLLKIAESKKVTAIITIEEATAKQIDQYAAMTKASADDVIGAALEHVFSKDADFKKHREEHESVKPKFPLRLKRPATPTPTPEAASGSTRTSTSAAR